MSLENIQNQLKDPRIKPGSAEEFALLQAARATKQQGTDNFAAVKRDALSMGMNEAGVVPPAAAQHAGEVALEHITGQHEIVPAPSMELPAAPAEKPSVLN
jgi:hypothetical protein